MRPIEVPSENDPRWEEAGIITELNLFPLKSAKGVLLNEAVAGKYGLGDGEGHFDRTLMIIDETGEFTSMRKYPRLVLISCKFHGDTVELSAPGFDSITVDLTQKGDLVGCKVWGDATNGYDLGDAVGQWITNYIGKENRSFRIVYHDGENIRIQAEAPGDSGITSLDDTCYYADGYGYLLATAASLSDLNQHLVSRGKSPLPDLRRLRPNVVISGPLQAFDEDNWVYLKVSDVIFKVCSPCGRCQAPNVDPDAGVPSKDFEPAKTLKTFRRIKDGDESPYFGMNLGVSKGVGSSIGVGNSVHVIRHKRDRFPALMMPGLFAAAAACIIGYYYINA